MSTTGSALAEALHFLNEHTPYLLLQTVSPRRVNHCRTILRRSHSLCITMYGASFWDRHLDRGQSCHSNHSLSVLYLSNLNSISEIWGAYSLAIQCCLMLNMVQQYQIQGQNTGSAAVTLVNTTNPVLIRASIQAVGSSNMSGAL